ncbi:hypothetical protein [Streptomyces sp. S1]|uniref:hypothetical protein n=1 Tax=Streptomyces sp. S1 TaxID=718288 RepID=UPI003D70331C
MDEEENREEEAVDSLSPKKKRKKRRPKQEGAVPPAPDPVGATMADRMDAWKSADSLLNREQDGEAKMVARKWVTSTGDEEIVIGPHDVLILATWLLYGAVVDED